MLAKSKLNSIEVLISKALIDSSISYNKFVLINDVLKKYHNIKEGIIHYFIKETEQNELLSNKKKKFCNTLNCIEHFLQ